MRIGERGIKKSGAESRYGSDDNSRFQAAETTEPCRLRPVSGAEQAKAAGYRVRDTALDRSWATNALASQKRSSTTLLRE